MLEIAFWCSVGLILYTYAGYPLLLYGLSRKKREVPPPAPAVWPSVTIVIPAYNEERVIRQKLENTLELDYAREHLQILVASDGSTDRTVEITVAYAGRGVELDHSPVRQGKVPTLNRVVPAARGEIVVATDAGALLAPGALKALVMHFANPEVGCVIGRKVALAKGKNATAVGESLYARYETFIKVRESRLHSCVGGHGPLLAFPKAFFSTIPVLGEDLYLPMTILLTRGLQVILEPKAVAQIPPAATLAGEFKRKIRTHVCLLLDIPHVTRGLNPFRSPVWWQFLSHHVFRLFVPVAMVGAFVVSAWLSGRSLLYFLAFVGQAAFYGAAVVGFLSERLGIRSRALVLPFYFVLANLAVLCAWISWLRVRGGYSYAWERTERLC